MDGLQQQDLDTRHDQSLVGPQVCARGCLCCKGCIDLQKWKDRPARKLSPHLISLLNSVYKICMLMIRNRLQDILEEHLCDTQYGFRPSCSTSHAIYRNKKVPT